MLIETVITSVAAALVRKGSLKELECVNVRAWYLFIAGLFIQNAPFFLKAINFNSLFEILNKNFFYIHLLSYIMIFIALALNSGRWSVKFVLSGTCLNFIVIFLNGGYMPVSPNALKLAGYPNIENLSSRIDFKHVLLTGNTRLGFLSDIIPSPPQYPLHQILSVGDIFIIVGIFLFFQEVMVRRKVK